MVTYFIVQMFMVHKTILDLLVQRISVGNQFQGMSNDMAVTFDTLGAKESFPKIEFSLLDQNKCWSHATFKEQQSSKVLIFSHPSLKRQKVQVSRVMLSTRGINNLFHVWRYFKVSDTFYIYPKKQSAPFTESSAETKEASQLQEKEFEFHIRYILGMPAKRIDWKKYASSNLLFSKSYSDNFGVIREINYSKLAGAKEEKLQKMSFLISKSKHQGISYTVVLPNKKLPVNNGQEHFVRSMELISEY